MVDCSGALSGIVIWEFGLLVLLCLPTLSNSEKDCDESQGEYDQSEKGDQELHDSGCEGGVRAGVITDDESFDRVHF